MLPEFRTNVVKKFYDFHICLFAESLEAKEISNFVTISVCQTMTYDKSHS